MSGSSSKEGSEVDFELETGAKASLEDALELLGEKRSSSREKGIQMVIQQLRHHFDSINLQESQLSLIDALKRCLKKGSIKEQTLAPLAIALCAISLGADSESLFQDVNRQLQELISTSKEDQVCCSVIEALAMICFVSNEDEIATVEILNLLQSLFKKTTSALIRRAAIKSWNFLLTSISWQHIADTLIYENVADLVRFLEDESVDIRVAAGESLAFLFEVARHVEKEQFDFANYEIDVNEMLERLHDLTTERGKIAKKDRDKQKSSFVALKPSIETGEVPTETLSFKNQKFEFQGWSQIRQLDFFRNFLGSGLQMHFESNDLLQEIFEIQIDKEFKKVQLTAVEKRMLLSQNSAESKARTKDLSRQRNNKASARSLDV